MPRRGDGPRPRVHAALARIGLILALFATACGEGRLPRPALSATAAPERAFTTYGEILPVRFTVRNDTGVPVILEKVEGLTGRRRVLATFREAVTVSDTGIEPAVPGAGGRPFVRFRAVLPAGGTSTFTAPIRCLAPGEDLLFLASPFRPGDMEGHALVEDGAGGLVPYDGGAALPARLYFPLDALPGNSGMARTEAKFPSPPPPFEPPVSTQGAWSFSPVLGGYVLRASGGGMEVFRPDGPASLPPVPFDFLDEVEDAGSAKVLSGEAVVEVTPADLAAFLADLQHRGRTIGFSDHPDKAPYQVDD